MKTRHHTCPSLWRGVGATVALLGFSHLASAQNANEPTGLEARIDRAVLSQTVKRGSPKLHPQLWKYAQALETQQDMQKRSDGWQLQAGLYDSVEAVLMFDTAADQQQFLSAHPDLEASAFNALPALHVQTTPAKLVELAELTEVAFVEMVDRSSTTTDAGPNVTAGDAILGAAQARAETGFDGSGTRVCVISDGIGGVGDAIRGGDLPPLSACGGPDLFNGAEGTAMLEIVHDLAPGAELAFCPGLGNLATLIDAYAWAADLAFGGEGCDIVVDDITVLNDRYFQDSELTAVIDDAAHRRGMTSIGSAGNHARRHYQERFDDFDYFNKQGFKGFHEFVDSDEPEEALSWVLSVPAEHILTVFLQWEEPFGNAEADFQIVLSDNGDPFTPDSSGAIIYATNENLPQDGSGNPQERARAGNITGEPQDVHVFVLCNSGPCALKDIELLYNTGPFPGSQQPRSQAIVVNPELEITEGSVIGHKTGRNYISVGAVSALDPGADDLQPFSTRGRTLLYWNADGSYDLDFRDAPTLVATDTVLVSNAGGFLVIDGNRFLFPGTSAAAPHVAGVAALALQANPGLPNRFVDLREVLTDSALDLGDDELFGFGRVDAVEAVEEAIDSRGFNPRAAKSIRAKKVSNTGVAAERLRRYYETYQGR